MEDKGIIKQLIANYGVQIVDVEKLPEAYCPGGKEHTKAIYLGCDPSNRHSTELPYAFAHESGLKIFNSFIQAHQEQLSQIRLTWADVYTQNLCRNYFTEETANNSKLWKQVANEFWIDQLKEELSVFDSSIPVLLTSGILYEVLLNPDLDPIKPIDFYSCKASVLIPAKDNKLNRPLIPMYRHYKYSLKLEEWKNYKEAIIEVLHGVL